jgi:uncharacterized protein (UPF0254 family)
MSFPHPSITGKKEKGYREERNVQHMKYMNTGYKIYDELDLGV